MRTEEKQRRGNIAYEIDKKSRCITKKPGKRNVADMKMLFSSISFVRFVFLERVCIVLYRTSCSLLVEKMPGGGVRLVQYGGVAVFG